MATGTPALVTKLRNSGTGRVFYEGKVHSYTVDDSPVWEGHYEFALNLDDGRQVVLSDAYENMGFVYRAPDSGNKMTNILVPLEDGEPDPVGIPDKKQLMSQRFLYATKPLYLSIQRGDTDPSELIFCRQIFASPEALLRTIQKEGDLDKAREAILRDVFQIS